jgi:hypothetical protein
MSSTWQFIGLLERMAATAREATKGLEQMRIGFWKSAENPEFACPELGENTECLLDFVSKLKALENVVKSKDSLQTIGMFPNMYHISRYGQYRSYDGSSICRICQQSNGYEEFVWFDHASGKTFIWPSGYAHYVSEHNVHPPTLFHQRVMDVDVNKFEEKWTEEIKDIILDDWEERRKRDVAVNVARMTSAMGSLSYAS